MAPKFSSKEIHFLKAESEDLNITPPEHYFCDLILSKTEPLSGFEERLEKTQIPGDNYLCAVMQISPEISDTLHDKVNLTFESTFNLFLDHERGIWENLGELSFILAFWDYDDQKKAVQLIETLKQKLSQTLKTDILVGVATFPFHDFSKIQTLENAIKAIDHAAFFGPDTLTEFDGVSLNISGDRFYHLNETDLAIKEYTKGLEIKPKDINLINSLGVCYAVVGDLNAAKTEFERAMKLNPKEVMVIYNIGLLYRIDEDLDKAILYLKKAHGIDEQIFEVELLLAHLLVQNDQERQAMPFVENALRLNPDSNTALRMKAEILLEEKKPEQAARFYNKAIKLNPSDAVSLSGYARCLELEDKNLRIALSFAKNSISLEPDNKLFQQRLAVIQEKLNLLESPAQIKSA